MFAHESFVLVGFLKISKHNVWVSQSILLQLLPMRTQNSNLPCASAFVRQSRTFHSITFYRMHTFLNWRNVPSWIPFGSDLDPNRVCKERERERLRERDWCRHIKVNIPSADRQLERERESEMCVFFLNFVSFFYSGNSSTYRSLQKIWSYEMSSGFNSWVCTILTRIRSRQSERKRFGLLKEERNSVVIRWVNIDDPAYRIV